MARRFILRTPAGNVVMQETAYSTEDLFQKMLADTSEVLSGDVIDPESPRRWILVSREMPIPDSDGGTNRWSLDHLFLDQDGIPTLVEVKRSSDTRIRREVVGQMLDYAANAVVYWPVEFIQQRMALESAVIGRTVEDLLAEFLDPTSDDAPASDAFWEKVHVNLRAGKIRMIFVADSIPPELQRIIEFLNEQMKSAEVLGLDVRLYTGGEGYELLVPTLIGRTADAQAVKASSPSTHSQWDEDRYLADMSTRCSEEAMNTVRSITTWMESRGIQAQFGGQGKTYGSLVAIYRHNGENYRPFVIYGDGSIEIRFNHMKERGIFASREKRLELLSRLNSIAGVSLPAEKVDSRPNMRIERIANPPGQKHFLDTWDWYLNIIHSGQ